MPTRNCNATIIHTDTGYELDIPNISWWSATLREGFKDGEKVIVTIATRKKPRSLSQNAFYFGNFLQSEIDCFKEMWGEVYTKEQMHDFNKSTFWATENVIEATGEIIRIPGSSSKQSTISFEERLEIARQWFNKNFEWVLPYPEKQEKLAL